MRVCLYQSPCPVATPIKARRFGVLWDAALVRSHEGTPTGKRLLRRPRRRWEESIRIDIKEIGSASVVKILSASPPEENFSRGSRV